jgi:kinesin family protein 2/24
MTSVFVRKKPLLEKNDYEIVKCLDDKTISVKRIIKTYDGKLKNKFTKYNFNGVFDDNKNNKNIFNNIIINNLNQDLSCFMYGQTSSGKTHTVLGKDNDEGIFILAGKELLNMSDELYISAYQIYNENIFDLLNGNNKLKLLEDRNNKFEIPDLALCQLNNMQDLDNSIKIILNNRSQASNRINISSSRSHAILIFRYVKDNNVINIKLIDLAGNERSKNSKILSLNDRLENKHINFSLFSLKECIRNIESRKNHIPFRRSKLTSVLRECFISPHKSIMIATLCSNNNNYYDIINTLNYSSRVNKFLNKPVVIEKYLKKSQKNLPKLKAIRKQQKKERRSLTDTNIINNKQILKEIKLTVDESLNKLNLYNSKSDTSLQLIKHLKNNNRIILTKIRNHESILNNIKDK